MLSSGILIAATFVKEKEWEPDPRFLLTIKNK